MYVMRTLYCIRKIYIIILLSNYLSKRLLDTNINKNDIILIYVER